MAIAEVDEMDELTGEPESLVGAKALALAMECSVQLVHRLAREGEIPAYRFAGCGWRFRISEVSKFCWCGGVAPTGE